MKMIDIKCKNCGYSMKRTLEQTIVICEACGACWSIEEETDTRASSSRPEEYNKMLEYVKTYNRLAIGYQSACNSGLTRRILWECGLTIVGTILIFDSVLYLKEYEADLREIRKKEKDVKQIEAERKLLDRLPEEFRNIASMRLLLELLTHGVANNIQEACKLSKKVESSEKANVTGEGFGEAVITSEYLLKRIQKRKAENKKHYFVPMVIRTVAITVVWIPALVLCYSVITETDIATKPHALLICLSFAIVVFGILPLTKFVISGVDRLKDSAFLTKV